MRGRVVVGVVVGAVALGGCTLTEVPGGLNEVVMDSREGGYWVHDHSNNRAMREGPFDTLEEARSVARGHNFVHHWSARRAYVTRNASGLGDWVPIAPPAPTAWPEW